MRSLGGLLKKVLAGFALTALLPGFARAGEAVASAPIPKIDTGDTAWVLMSAALVFLMTPGLAFF